MKIQFHKLLVFLASGSLCFITSTGLVWAAKCDKTGTVCLDAPAAKQSVVLGAPIQVKGFFHSNLNGSFAVTVFNDRSEVIHYNRYYGYQQLDENNRSFSFEVPTDNRQEGDNFTAGSTCTMRVAWRGCDGEPCRQHEVEIVRVISDPFNVVSDLPQMRGVVTFRVPLFDMVLPDTPPNVSRLLKQIEISVAPGEYEPASFAVRSSQDLKDVRVSLPELIGCSAPSAGTKIPIMLDGEKSLDLRVVKVWLQSGQGNDPDGAVLVPELLVYNDLESLSAVVGQSLPVVAETLRTDIPANVTKQFWLTVKVPTETQSGDYQTTLRLVCASGQIAKLPVLVHVLPIQLKEPRAVHSIYYNTYPLNSDEYVKKELTDLQRHGIKCFRTSGAYKINDQSLSPPSQANMLPRLLRFIKEMGFRGCVIRLGKNYRKPEIYQDILSRYSDIPIWFYGQDEPNKLDQPTELHSLRHHIRMSYDIHTSGGRVFTAIQKSVSDMLNDSQSPAYDQIDPLSESMGTPLTFRQENITNEKLDFPNYNAQDLSIGPDGRPAAFWDYIQHLRDGSVRKDSRPEFYYWQGWHEKPMLNRLFAGNFLWTSHMNGVMVFNYASPVGDAFNDFDSASSDQPPARDMMMTYPSAQGPIPTLMWEAFREGYDDVRYMTTLYDLALQLQRKDPGYTDQLYLEFVEEFHKYEEPWKYPNLSGDDFAHTRDLMIRCILEIQDKLAS